MATRQPRNVEADEEGYLALKGSVLGSGFNWIKRTLLMG